MDEGLTIITGADSGMGREITLAVAKSGSPILMACRTVERANGVAEEIRDLSHNSHIEVRPINLASLASVDAFTKQLLSEKRPIRRIVNNAGVLTSPIRTTEDGLETLVSVNYVAPYFLTRRLLPLMTAGSRIVNTVSCTYAIGKLDDAFFEKGQRGSFRRIPVYSNTKLALLLFTLDLAEQLKPSGITVNASDPGIVSTDMIRMNEWFDSLTDIFYRPFIRTAAQGASTAIYLALSPDVAEATGGCYANCRRRSLSNRIQNHPMRHILFSDTAELLRKKHFEIE